LHENPGLRSLGERCRRTLGSAREELETFDSRAHPILRARLASQLRLSVREPGELDMDSSQKRDRDRKQRQRRQDKEARRKEKAERKRLDRLEPEAGSPPVPTESETPSLPVPSEGA